LSGFNKTEKINKMPFFTYFFALEGVPSVFLFTGGYADAHQPTDTSDRINAEKKVDVVRLAYLAVMTISDRPAR
jgi:hypothetical protein